MPNKKLIANIEISAFGKPRQKYLEVCFAMEGNPELILDMVSQIMAEREDVRELFRLALIESAKLPKLGSHGSISEEEFRKLKAQAKLKAKKGLVN